MSDACADEACLAAGTLQKPLLRREISNGLYHYSSFFIAKSLISLPFQLMFACIFNGSVYFLVRSSVTSSVHVVSRPHLSCRHSHVNGHCSAMTQ